MADIFYQGEDIVLSIEVYEDDNLTEKCDLDNLKVDMILYHKNSPSEIIASTDIDSELVISKISSLEQMVLTIPAEKTRTLGCGILTVEIKLTDTSTNNVQIAVNSAIRIENSRIGNLS
ncbi:MAG: hypothetical protein R3Y51_06070 [Rikenellaceae bacterium]